MNHTPSLAANMEWLFTEAGDSIADRIRAAAAHGIPGVELWGWRQLDLDAVEAALTETGTALVSVIVDPQLDITDPATHEVYLDGVRDSLEVARRLGSAALVVVARQYVPHLSPAQQHDAVVTALRAAAELLEGSGITLLLEPLNSRVDHLGTYLSTTAEGLAIVREVNRPELKLLLDVYHALMMGEDLRAELAGHQDAIGHVQIADIPGRHEPGTGSVDWPDVLRTLVDLGYTGPIGLEYLPTVGTRESMVVIESVLADARDER